METIEEDFSDSEAETESVCAECEKPVVYCIVCLNEEIGEYGIQKLHSQWIIQKQNTHLVEFYSQIYNKNLLFSCYKLSEGF